MKNKIKLYLIIGFLIGTVDCLLTWVFRFRDGNRSNWLDEKAHDIWLIVISAIQIVSGVLLWPIKVIATIFIIIKGIVTGKCVLMEDMEKSFIKKY